jgi:hypothetical protein
VIVGGGSSGCTRPWTIWSWTRTWKWARQIEGLLWHARRAAVCRGGPQASSAAASGPVDNLGADVDATHRLGVSCAALPDTRQHAPPDEGRVDTIFLSEDVVKLHHQLFAATDASFLESGCYWLTEKRQAKHEPV